MSKKSSKGPRPAPPAPKKPRRPVPVLIPVPVEPTPEPFRAVPPPPQPPPPAADPPPKPRGKPGPKASYLTSEEMRGILEKLKAGKGRDVACEEQGIGYERFKRECDENSEFKAAVQSAQRAWRQRVDQAGLLMALDGDKDVMFKIWDRIDKGKQADRSWKLAKAELKLKRVVALHQSDTPPAAAADIKDGMARMPSDELLAFRASLRKLAGLGGDDRSDPPAEGG